MIAYIKDKYRKPMEKGIWTLVDGTGVLPDFHFYTNDEMDGFDKAVFAYITGQIENGGFDKIGVPTLFLGCRSDLN